MKYPPNNCTVIFSIFCRLAILFVYLYKKFQVKECKSYSLAFNLPASIGFFFFFWLFKENKKASIGFIFSTSPSSTSLSVSHFLLQYYEKLVMLSGEIISGLGLFTLLHLKMHHHQEPQTRHGPPFASNENWSHL